MRWPPQANWLEAAVNESRPCCGKARDDSPALQPQTNTTVEASLRKNRILAPFPFSGHERACPASLTL
jgi:hypothetical protein